jgi:hypothetical protein
MELLSAVCSAVICGLQEKQQALLAEQEEQQRLDLLMEIERLRALEAYQVGPDCLTQDCFTHLASQLPLSTLSVAEALAVLLVGR